MIYLQDNLETGHWIKNFVNDCYLTTNTLELLKLRKSFKMLVFLRQFLSFCSCTTLKIFRNAVC